MRLIVHTPYTAQYPHPIRFKAGEAVRLTGREDAWEDHPDWRWLWAIDVDGREGWMSSDFVERHTAQPVARRDYEATELTLSAGAEIEALTASCGWYWARAQDGRLGWVPASHCAVVEA